ncbi:MAG: ATP-grasp domain-containing protein [Sciscionella sp.]
MPANTVLLLEAFGNSGEVLADAIRAEGFGVAVATHQQLYDNYSPCLKSKIDYLIIIDYADEQVVDHIIDAAQHHHVVGVLTGWEFFTGLCAEVAARLGLPGNDPSRSDAGRSKWAMAKAFDFGGVRHATTVHAADAVSLHGQIAAAVLDYPVVVKPTENAGSVGVTVVHRSSELDAAVAAAQAFPREFPHDIELDDSVLAQAYVGGREFSVESLASGGEIQHQAITEKATTEGAFRAETGHTIPAALTQEESTALTDAATAGLRALGFTNGAAHIEIKLCNGDAWVIEAGLRPAGDHIVKLVTHATGTDFARAYVRAVTGGPLPPPRPLQSQAGVRFLTPDTAGEVSAATICGPIPHGVIERGLLVDAGDHVGAVADNVSRLGYVIATANDRDQLEQALHAGLKSLDVSLR